MKLRTGVTGAILDENGKRIGSYHTKPGLQHFSVFKRSKTGEDLRYTRYVIKGKLDDGRNFSGTEDLATGVINFKTWEEKTGLPGSIVDVTFSHRR